MKHIPLKIEHDEVFDRVTIEGINYSGDLFREWGKGMPEGAYFKLLKREDGVLTIEKIDNTRIKIGPLEMACKKCGNKDTFTLDLENPNTKKEDKPNAIDVEASNFGRGDICDCGGSLTECRLDKFRRHKK